MSLDNLQGVMLRREMKNVGGGSGWVGSGSAGSGSGSSGSDCPLGTFKCYCNGSYKGCASSTSACINAC